VTYEQGMMDLPDKEAGSVCTPAADVFMLPLSGILDDDMMAAIIASGFSRIPVYGS